MSVTAARTAIFAALSLGTLSACGATDPVQKQFAKDIKKQKEKRMGVIDEAFVSSWTYHEGETVNATCMVYGSDEHLSSVVISPHGDGIATVERGSKDTPEWVKYCSNPVVDQAGGPIRKRRL